MSGAKMVERMRAKQQQLGCTAPPNNGQAPPRRDGPKGQGHRFPNFRLPDGATFQAAYDGAKHLWTVTLAVPGLPAAETTASSIHAALIYLGRQWYAEHGTPTTSA
jgi:hypothetical protein